MRKRLEQARAVSTEHRDLDYKIRQLQRAQVDAVQLTQSPLWDGYLQQIAALNEADEEAFRGVVGPSELGSYMSAEQCQKLEFERAVLRAKIQARNECIQIPRRILQGTSSTGD